MPRISAGISVSIDLVGKTARRRLDGTFDATLPPLPAYVHAVAPLKASDDHRRLTVAIHPLKADKAPGAKLPIELTVTHAVESPRREHGFP